MTNYKFGDVVLVPFPFTDQSATKKRPAVVVSSSAYHADHINLILMAVSSQVTASLRAGEALLTDWKQAGLIGPSVVKAVLTTIERKLVIRKLGSLVDADRDAVAQALRSILCR
ncbi:MAG TPA: type II toxin-antitoxin system PemK/MazF family toxin [Blastocatellia bacterium]|nr:type II toxin-antitoxin system PemK/MazF family toxin [Blastocatellia bacterium]